MKPLNDWPELPDWNISPLDDWPDLPDWNIEPLDITKPNYSGDYLDTTASLQVMGGDNE